MRLKLALVAQGKTRPDKTHKTRDTTKEAKETKEYMERKLGGTWRKEMDAKLTLT